ncbi:MAG: Glycosyl transferase family 2 [Candidatus Amesbacteria bacterium GW2011_GWA2_47_11b]|uniref:Glycosyl transferase family 2 n=3 Tax=Candidatus Amesiibacteriota TaxID=1752730 RepID=A0A0G1SLC8_9BACT|nr:MAG: Glycosyl transferase family 2 [Microgenomates group bacterium GW2011_GWC1_46_20]KKU58225.1 MAG: Glycosyl transferase family 2 [Candidatus Amesbacteria bacterium GW2011_GWA2_47_11b]KKU70299.1 MAG: Glycosyl transferase family 2 [Candidatus Amesbacteria bacterium GW2011_GWA1_47_20]KKU83544.1 MAG: Glycosyl transferase family 2 [Candidatus Amesbacteria bacterium GW2011_GWC2_47_8]
MPAYNEAENIGLMIEELFGKEFPQIKNTEMHLLVVDDFSPDGTGNIVKKYQAEYKNLHLLQKPKEGLGWAYIRGMQYAVNKLGADAVMEMDADFQHPPRFVKDMVAAFLNGADYVIGSRYIRGGSIPKEWEFSRKAVSFLGNLFIRMVLLKPQIHDLTTGFRLTRVKGVLDQIDLEHLMEPTRFAYKVDLLYQSIKNAKKVVEVPLEFASRAKEKSKFNPKEMISTFKVAIILGIKDKQKIIKFGLVGFLGYLVNAFALYLFTKLSWPGWAAWGLSTELAILSNFTWNNLWTFRDQQINGLAAIASKFLQFNLTSAGGLLIQVGVGVATDYLLGSQYRQIVLPLTIGFLVMPYNYLMYTLVIWRKKASNPK